MTNTRPGDQTQTAAELETAWKTDARWNGVTRDYSADDVIALRGSVREEHTLARRGAERLEAYAGNEGDVFHGLTAAGGGFDKDVTSYTDRAIRHLRAKGEDPIVHTPSTSAPADVVNRHLNAWSHVVNMQIRQDAAGRIALQHMAEGLPEDLERTQVRDAVQVGS